jgi:5-methylcytosine-specific restriction protein A
MDDPRSPGLRCPACQAEATRRRNTDAPGRPTAAQRGYGAGWRRISAEVTASAPCCHWCGGGFTTDNPATADHIVPVARGGTHDRSNLVAACRRCNSRRGGQMRKRKKSR